MKYLITTCHLPKIFSLGLGIVGLSAVLAMANYAYNLASSHPQVVSIVQASSDDAVKLASSDAILINPITLKTIYLQYGEMNVPGSADIRIVSTDLNGQVIYQAKNVDLSQRLSYSFNLDITKGAYATVISAPEVKTKIMPFLVSDSADIRVDLGSFELNNPDINNQNYT